MLNTGSLKKNLIISKTNFLMKSPLQILFNIDLLLKNTTTNFYIENILKLNKFVLNSSKIFKKENSFEIKFPLKGITFDSFSQMNKSILSSFYNNIIIKYNNLLVSLYYKTFWKSCYFLYFFLTLKFTSLSMSKFNFFFNQCNSLKS